MKSMNALRIASKNEVKIVVNFEIHKNQFLNTNNVISCTSWLIFHVYS